MTLVSLWGCKSSNTDVVSEKIVNIGESCFSFCLNEARPALAVGAIHRERRFHWRLNEARLMFVARLTFAVGAVYTWRRCWITSCVIILGLSEVAGTVEELCGFAEVTGTVEGSFNSDRWYSWGSLAGHQISWCRWSIWPGGSCFFQSWNVFCLVYYHCCSIFRGMVSSSALRLASMVVLVAVVLMGLCDVLLCSCLFCSSILVSTTVGVSSVVWSLPLLYTAGFNGAVLVAVVIFLDRCQQC